MKRTTWRKTAGEMADGLIYQFGLAERYRERYEEAKQHENAMAMELARVEGQIETWRNEARELRKALDKAEATERFLRGAIASCGRSCWGEMTREDA